MRRVPGILIVLCVGVGLVGAALSVPATCFAAEGPDVISYKDAEKYLDQKKTVAGTIVATHVSEGSGNLYLNFGDYKKELSIQIPKDKLEAFPSDAAALYKGKKVEATGMIKKEKKKLRLVVTDPIDLKIVE
jgi:hypothetical protein